MKRFGGSATNGKTNEAPGRADVLFWRYLLTTGAVILALAVLWWLGLSVLMQMKFVYPASTAADGADDLVYELEAGARTPEEIPYYYRWAVFDRSRQVMDPGNMNRRQLSYAKSALAGDSIRYGIFYAQYHRMVELPTGEICVVQYDYSMPYGLEKPAGPSTRVPDLRDSGFAGVLAVDRHFVDQAFCGTTAAGRCPADRCGPNHCPAAAGYPAGRPDPGAGVWPDPGRHGGRCGSAWPSPWKANGP